MTMQLSKGSLAAKSLFLFVLLLISVPSQASQRDTLDIGGEWYYRLLQAPAYIPGEGTLTLPGTLDTNGKGITVPMSDNTTQLSRKVTYSGDVSYFRTIDIPLAWKGKTIELVLERTRASKIKVDGNEIGSSRKVSSPHRYDLTSFLSPGQHEIEITVNNGDSIPGTVRRNSHSFAEATQTNWNGIIGDMMLVSKDPAAISRAIAIPDPKRKGFKIDLGIGSVTREPLIVRAETPYSDPVWHIIEPGGDDASFFVPLNETPPRWDEWNPQMTTVMLTVVDNNGIETDRFPVSAAYRDFSTSGTTFTINGKPTFLRGKHDACVFPYTGYPPTDVDSWREYFSIMKDYGINHIRFHSWCPPEAAFTAADEAGVYLQVELPIWGELDRDLTDLNSFLKEDLSGILETYSGHPSFVMFAVGNELWGDKKLMKEFMDTARDYNPGILATYGSNIYLGMDGYIDGEDYLVASRVGEEVNPSTYARGSFSFADDGTGGALNNTYPNSQMNFSQAVKASPVPVVGHETGEYQMYPNFNESAKYTGVLRADNLEEFKKRAIETGLYRKNERFFKSSGKWAAKLYKADMEMALRTPGMGGFQVLDIQDYPGQGTALIGILDAFMDNKGHITPEEWRQSCDELTVLAEFPRFTFEEGETVTVPIKVANFSDNESAIAGIQWHTPFASGTINPPSGKGLIEAGEIRLNLPHIKTPVKSNLKLTSSDGREMNSYDFWIYPQKMKEVKGVNVTRDINDALYLLGKGEKVILIPDSATVADASLGPLFQTDFWNYRMFRTICDMMEVPPSPGTLGLLINEDHPVFRSFPTDYHTDWQWYPIVHNSFPLIIDRLPVDIDPIVEPIDNVERNFRLALILECAVGKGKLMIIAADMDKASEYPEGRWLLQSAKEYVASKEFKPKITLDSQQVVNLLTKPSTARKIKELKNETYNSHWD